MAIYHCGKPRISVRGVEVYGWEWEPPDPIASADGSADTTPNGPEAGSITSGQDEDGPVSPSYGPHKHLGHEGEGSIEICDTSPERRSWAMSRTPAKEERKMKPSQFRARMHEVEQELAGAADTAREARLMSMATAPLSEGETPEAWLDVTISAVEGTLSRLKKIRAETRS